MCRCTEIGSVTMEIKRNAYLQQLTLRKDNGMIVGTFSFIIGEEPTYQVIKNGKWTDGRLYGTIHRLASNGIVKGIARACFEYCIKQIDYIRIDTHKDNISMQTAIERFGFHKCGNIYVKGGAERIAYDYIS